MKNKITDLRNHLFDAIECLNDDEKTKNPITLERELKKAKAIAELGSVLVDTAKVEVDFIKVNTGLSPASVKGSDFINPAKQIESGK